MTSEQTRLLKWFSEFTNEQPPPVAFAKLCTTLKSQMARAAQGPPGQENELEWVTGAIVAIIEFLESNQFVKEQQVAAPFYRLSTAISDVAFNRRTPDLFTPPPTGKGGANSPTQDMNLQAIASRACEELIASLGDGPGAKQKAAGVVRDAIHEHVPAYRDNITDARIMGWYDRMQKARNGSTKVPNVLASRYAAPLPSYIPDSPAARAEFLLTMIKQGGGVLSWR